MAFFQIFYLLVCRTLTEPVRAIGWTSNRTIFAGIGILLILQAGFVHLPFMQVLFHTEHLTLTQWAVAAAAGAVIAPVVSIEKWCRRRRNRPAQLGPTNGEVPDGRHV
ncbi:MAG: cation transporting ATPase C-terminal domain-containing protein [Pseudonocardiaceae bacterium]